MSLQNVLQQLLGSAQELVNKPSTLSSSSGSKSNSTSALSGFAGGALSGGALALLLGNKKFRKMGGKVAAYGGVAALGALAYRSYADWKKKEHPVSTNTSEAIVDPTAIPTSVQLEKQSQLVLAAMISAAKADGHINAQEQELLDVEFAKLGSSPSEKNWLTEQLQGPADPAKIAGLATTEEEKVELYLVSVLVTQADTFMEKAYLDELARQLQLEEGLKLHLEQTALNIAI